MNPHEFFRASAELQRTLWAEYYAMAKTKQIYTTRERATAVMLDGIAVIVFKTNDLTIDALRDSYKIHLEKENYEYCAALVAEAEERGIKLR